MPLRANLFTLSRASSSPSQLRCWTSLPLHLSSSTHGVILAASHASAPLLPLAWPLSFSHVILALSLSCLSSSAHSYLRLVSLPLMIIIALGGHSPRHWGMCFCYLFFSFRVLMLLVIYWELERFFFVFMTGVVSICLGSHLIYYYW